MARTVFAVTMQAVDTYWLLLGVRQAVHELALFTANVNVLPAAHCVHTPLTPPPLPTVPWTYAVLMYCPAAHEVTAAARPVSAVAVQALVTYCVLFGAVQAVHELAVLTADMNVLPPVQAVHTPLVPSAVVLPAA